MPGFSRADALFFLADRFQPIATVIARWISSEATIGQFHFKNRHRIGFNFASADANGALLTHEHTIGFTAMKHFQPVGIDKSQAGNRFGIFGWDHLDRAGHIHVEGPLGDIKMMRSHVGQAATGVFTVSAPCREMAMHAFGAQVRVVGPEFSGAYPTVPVGTRWNILAWQIACLRRRANANANHLKFTDKAVANAFHRITKMAAELAALLTSRLKNNA